MANENTQVAVQQPGKVNVVKEVKGILAKENVKKRFHEVLGRKAPQFMASIVNVISATPALKQCEPNSIMGAAFVAASFDLPIDSNLGFAALVPYDKSFKDANGQWQKIKMAQFQMMYKGFIQLAIRSGYYEKMNYAAVYEDELVSYNPITGEIEFVTDFSNCTQRSAGEEDKIVGYHARKYSQSYRYDIEKKKTSSKWSTDFEAMALKTVIKLLLSKWGILSVDMQRAIQDDQKVYDEEGNGNYLDNQPDQDNGEDPFSIEGSANELEELDITEQVVMINGVDG